MQKKEKKEYIFYGNLLWEDNIALGRQILLWGVEVTLLWGGSYSGK